MKNAKFLQRAGAFALALTMALSLAGCGQAASGSSQAASSAPVSSAAASSEAASSQAQGPIQLTDQAGRQVELEEPAQSLVSCYYITTYATLALGVSDRVVGLEKKAETRPVYQMADPALLKKPQLGTLKEFDVEAAAALEPDLVLMPVKLMDYVDALTELGIPVLVVDPEDQDRLEEMLTLIGQACGVEDRAQSLIDYYHEQENRMAQLTEGQESPLVYMGGNSSYLETATNAMYQGSLIQLAGGQNAAGELEGDYWTEISYESLLAMAPEVIILPSAASYTVEDVLNDAQLAGVPAVEEGRVYQMPGQVEEWDSPVPSGILGALWLTSALHPESYSQEEFVVDAQDFYREFYGFELDAHLLTA